MPCDTSKSRLVIFLSPCLHFSVLSFPVSPARSASRHFISTSTRPISEFADSPSSCQLGKFFSDCQKCVRKLFWYLQYNATSSLKGNLPFVANQQSRKKESNYEIMMISWEWKMELTFIVLRDKLFLSF